MKIYVDLSVLCSGGEGTAVGRVSGMLELAAVPPIGSLVVLAHPANGIQPIAVPGFSGMMKVAEVRFEPVSSSAVNVAMSLEDVTVASIEDGRKVMNFLAQGFGLSGEEYDLDE